MKRLSEAQRRVMTYLTHGRDNYAQWNPFSRRFMVKHSNGETILPDVHQRTIDTLVDRGLVESAGSRGFAASAEAWALAHKGQLR